MEQYLSTSYRPDCDYVDGEIPERNAGELPHSDTQGNVYFRLRQLPGLARRVLPEQRIQVATDRFRIPDVCVVREGALRTKILRQPPLLCVESCLRRTGFSALCKG